MTRAEAMTPPPVSGPTVAGRSGLATTPAVHLVLFGVQLGFATLAIAGKVVLRTLDPHAFALVRLAGGALAFTLLARGRVPRLPLRDLALLAGCTVLGIYGNQILYLHGLALTSATDATVLVATIPVFTVLFALLLRREAVHRGKLAGIGVALAGVLFLVGAEAFGASPRATIEGDVLVALNAATCGLYFVLVRELAVRHGSLPVIHVGFLIGTLYALPFGVPAIARTLPLLDQQGWLLVAYVVLVPTVCTYLGNAWALRRAPASLVATYVYVQPTVAALLAWALLGEEPSLRIVIAAAAVFAGIRLVTQARPAAP